MNPQQGAFVLIIYIRPVDGKNKTAILEQEGVFSVIPVQNIPHIAQTVAVQQRFRLGRGNLPAYDLDWAARIDDKSNFGQITVQPNCKLYLCKEGGHTW